MIKMKMSKKNANIAIEKLKYTSAELFVPEWDGYYPDLDLASTEQKDFIING